MRRYADIARRVGLGGTSEKAQVNALIEKIESFNRAMNIPKTIQEFGVKEDEFLEKLDAIAQMLSAMPAQAPTREPSTTNRWQNCLNVPSTEQRLTSKPYT